MLERFLSNHVLANLTFILVLLIGISSYANLPREQDPEINFNWIDITTVLPGASANDVEARITDKLEDAVRNVSDIKFVSSTSRESISSILVRFEDIDERTFDKRVADLRRELQAQSDEMPDEATDPRVLEITTANAFPTAMVAVVGPADDENLRRQGRIVKQDLERLEGVSSVMASGLLDPELHVEFDPVALSNLGISPSQVADTVAVYFRDVSAGRVQVQNESWLVRMQGTNNQPDYLATLPILGTNPQVRLDNVAEVTRGREKADRRVIINNKPAILLSITKKNKTNTLELVDRINAYIEKRHALKNSTGVGVTLVDDQTDLTRNALNIMQTNALLGLLMVLIVTWLFLGNQISFITCIGIPFILMGTFWVLSSLGQTLNVMVLLGVVISLGMLVDDAVVVAEAIYYRWQRGEDILSACLSGLREVAAPVTAAVLTTMAAFLPLMLLPGILGKFMYVIPLVVTVALAISLIEAFWMLPAHTMGWLGPSPAAIIKPEVTGWRLVLRRIGHAPKTIVAWIYQPIDSLDKRVEPHRKRIIHKIRIIYTLTLIKVLRRPKASLGGVTLGFILALAALSSDTLIRKDFFASDPIRLFYVNVEMPIGTPLDDNIETIVALDSKLKEVLHAEELRAILGYAGIMFTETAPFFGDRYGQITISLKPKTSDMRTVDEVITAARTVVDAYDGTAKLSILRIAGGPPVTKPVSVKVRGTSLEEISQAAAELKTFLSSQEGFLDISDDAAPGQRSLTLKANTDALLNSNINPSQISRSLRLMIDGEVVASMQDQGETLDVRVRAIESKFYHIDQALQLHLPSQDGRRIPLSSLVTAEYGRSPDSIRHYDFRRTVTIESDINKELINEVQANDLIRQHWAEVLHSKYPDIDLDFSGLLDDIEESLGALGLLSLMGALIMYLILGTQFRSYAQPLMILSSVPMAFTGVTLGLLVSRNPISLYTLYGIVALSGIAVNSAIVLISAANDRLKLGMSLLHATIYAARRRVIPILITTMTTIAGLFSLATGLGGKSLIWGPMAASIVWGLMFSTVLTLLVIPLIYRLSMRNSLLVRHQGH